MTDANEASLESVVIALKRFDFHEWHASKIGNVWGLRQQDDGRFVMFDQAKVVQEELDAALDALRELHDLANADHPSRYAIRSNQAFAKAAELLKRHGK